MRSIWFRPMPALFGFAEGPWKSPLAKALRKLRRRHKARKEALFRDQRLVKRYGNKGEE